MALTKTARATAICAVLAAVAFSRGAKACAADPGAAEAAGRPKDPGVVVQAPRKIDLPLLTEPVLETPQTITLITAQMIAVDGLNDLRDILKLDPSVSAHADEDSGQGTNVAIRGFSARNDLYRDGELDIGRYYRDPFDLETVEVLTGPSSVLFGRGSTGGAVNSVSKKPGLTPTQAEDLSIGTDDLERFTADVNAPLSRSSAVRINGMIHSSRTAGRDEVYSQRAAVSPVVELGLGTPTQFIFGFMHQSEWGRPDYGVPWIDIVSPSGVSHPAEGTWRNFYGFKNDYARDSDDMATAEIRRRLNGSWQVRDQVRYAWFDRSFRATEPGVTSLVAEGAPTSAIIVTRTVRGVASTESLLSDQVSLSGRLDFWGVTHKPVLGGEIGRQTSDPTTSKYANVPATVLDTPVESTFLSVKASIKSAVRFTADTAGAFVGDTIEFWRNFEAEGVVRVDRFAAHYVSAVPTPVTLNHSDVEPSYRAAFIYKPAPGGRTYVMWGTSFDPSAEALSLSAATASLAPERNQTVEAGVKWELHRSALLSAAVFRTVQTNYRETSPVDPTVTTIAGTARSQGVELLAQGRPSPAWLVLAGYTYLDAQIISSPNADLRQPLQNAPRNSLRLFSTYDVSHAGWRGSRPLLRSGAKLVPGLKWVLAACPRLYDGLRPRPL